MHLLCRYDVAPIGRNDAMFANKYGEANIIYRKDKHRSQTKRTSYEVRFVGETFDWMSEPRFLICRKQRKPRARRGE